MDKELLRVVIILLGLLVMIGMVLWQFIKGMRNKRDADDYFDDVEYEQGLDGYEVEELEDDFGMFASGSDVDGDALLSDDDIQPQHKDAVKAQPKPLSKTALPALIEFSLVARADEGFNGEELFEAFERNDLKYGSVKVFERVDKNRLVDFAVASMIDPGTFPDNDLEQFYCPGIVFYMQPREVDNPLRVFDDFMDTIDTLAVELDGVVWDNQRQPLTAETIAQFRQMLAR
jgi:cell division protein ZipA